MTHREWSFIHFFEKYNDAIAIYVIDHLQDRSEKVALLLGVTTGMSVEEFLRRTFHFMMPEIAARRNEAHLAALSETLGTDARELCNATLPYIMARLLLADDADFEVSLGWLLRQISTDEVAATAERVVMSCVVELFSVLLLELVGASGEAQMRVSVCWIHLNDRDMLMMVSRRSVPSTT
jgi:hypothetical protein